jgi:hypothetical protein
MNEYSLSDISAVTGNRNNDGMFGNDSWAWLIVLLLFGYGGRGFGNFGGGMPCGAPATQADLAAGFNNSAVLSNLNDLALGQAGLQQTLLQGFNGVERGFCDLSHQLSDCCCTTKGAIADLKYTVGQEACDTRHAIYNSSRDIIDNANANSRAILDFLTQDKISTLTAENQALKFQASQTAQNAFITANQEAQTAELIRRLGRDCPVPAFVVPNPNCCYGNPYGAGNACGCNGGF